MEHDSNQGPGRITGLSGGGSRHGQFEQLFEQFRRVFVDVLEHVPESQGKLGT
jgi:hypothetical protein